MHSASVCRCNKLVQQIAEEPPGRPVVHLLDDISDHLCHATDAANFCTQAHAHAAWREASRRAAHGLNAYMAALNTDKRLWTALSATMQHAEQAAGWTLEEHKVGASLLLEFEQAGMGHDTEKSAQYQQLTAREQELCAQLTQFEVCVSLCLRHSWQCHMVPDCMEDRIDALVWIMHCPAALRMQGCCSHEEHMAPASTSPSPILIIS